MAARESEIALAGKPRLLTLAAMKVLVTGGAGYIGLPEVNHPYRGWKLSYFNGGIRVPFFAKTSHLAHPSLDRFSVQPPALERDPRLRVFPLRELELPELDPERRVVRVRGDAPFQSVPREGS